MYCKILIASLLVLAVTFAAQAQQTPLSTSNLPALSGDVSCAAGSGTCNLAAVYSGPASCTAPQILVPTAVDIKGRITAGQCVTPATGGSVSVTAADPCITITPSPGTGTFTVGSSNNVTDQATAPFTIGPANVCQIVRVNGGATAISVALAQAGTGTGEIPPSGAEMVLNIGAAQATVLPSVSKIDGFSSVILAPGGWIYLVADSAGNYAGLIGGPSGSGFGQ